MFFVEFIFGDIDHGKNLVGCLLQPVHPITTGFLAIGQGLSDLSPSLKSATEAEALQL